MKKFLIANKTQKQKIFSLYNGTLTAVQPGEYKIICMFDERAIAAYTKASTDSWVNGVFITCNPKVINKFVEDAKNQPIMDVTPIQDADVQAVGTEDSVATNTEDGVDSTDVSTDTEDSDNADDSNVEDSTETEDTDVETDEPDSEETVTDTAEDESVTEDEPVIDDSEDVDVADTEEDADNLAAELQDPLQSKSLTELRDLCIAEGLNAKRWTKTQCIEELNKLTTK